MAVFVVVIVHVVVQVGVYVRGNVRPPAAVRHRVARWGVVMNVQVQVDILVVVRREVLDVVVHPFCVAGITCVPRPPVFHVLHGTRCAMRDTHSRARG